MRVAFGDDVKGDEIRTLADAAFSTGSKGLKYQGPITIGDKTYQCTLNMVQHGTVPQAVKDERKAKADADKAAFKAWQESQKTATRTRS